MTSGSRRGAEVRAARCGRCNARRQPAERRRQTQPLGNGAAARFFTNPPGDHAARLNRIRRLRAFRWRAVCPRSTPNFILNEGDATATDLEQLFFRAANSAAVHGCWLTEVKMSGAALMHLRYEPGAVRRVNDVKEFGRVAVLFAAPRASVKFYS